MSQRYPGGLINRSAPVVVGPTGTPPEGGSASGVWTLEQAAGYIKQGLWPLPKLPGELFSWGANYQGQLGQNNTITLSSPVQVGSSGGWSELALGDQALAIKVNNTLWSWGLNNVGQLGQNNLIYRSSPVQVGALTVWSKVATGGSFSASVRTSGTLWTWGNNSGGQLGRNNRTSYSNPVQVGALTDWSQVTAGDTFCFAIKTNGTMWAWGQNQFFQLGLNSYTTSYYRSSPVQIGSDTNWARVSAGRNGGFAIKTNGTLWSWGRNNRGQLGLNISYSNNRAQPFQVGALTDWATVSAGNYFCVAVKTNGTLWSWGRNNNGQLGQNTGYGTERSSPVQVGSLTNWSKISSGASFCRAIKTDGTLWAWGNGSSGQLGRNNTITTSSPVQVGSLATWIQLSQGFSTYSALATK